MYHAAVLETPRLLMRKFNLDDVPEYFRLGSDPEVSRYVGSEPITTLEEARQLLIGRQRHDRKRTRVLMRVESFTGAGAIEPVVIMSGPAGASFAETSCTVTRPKRMAATPTSAIAIGMKATIRLRAGRGSDASLPAWSRISSG